MHHPFQYEHLKKHRTYQPGISEWHGYSCNTCKTMYASHKDAERCFEQGYEPRFKPGDIVVERYELEEPHGSYSWFDGDPDWILHDLPEGGSHGLRGIAFYYVVTAVMSYATLKKGYGCRGNHEPVYVVLTRGLKHLRRGWTTDEGHEEMILAPNPPEKVIRQGQKFVGFTTGELL